MRRPRLDRLEDAVERALMRLGARDEARDLLLLHDLPVDEFLDIGVVGVDDDHLGRAPRGAARLDRAGRPVADLEEAHQARGLAAARELLALAAQEGEVGAGARAVLEQAGLSHPQIHDATIVDQVVGHRLDEAGMGLWVLVGAARFCQLARLVIHVVMALARGPSMP
jgi:hypothetical protein